MSQMNDFREVLDDLNLREIFNEGGSFTWWNGRSNTTSVRAKLDRGVGNLAFYQLQVGSSVRIIPTITSNNHALHLAIIRQLQPYRIQKRTRFEPR